ncbi:TadE/TadG family type IV pilus assembly protein [Sphingomonas sp.]|uniref:TadE/TadG family type IV pilus assembly protein n=1 Tax=Sphingomonas sp. TaxID=28214 RepID=UPI001DECB40C|nr:TadE/TadG family type IV pilus assembly protein [Sphingomonas sp.]MBX9795663.1 pilus assembly protein [Sphingomonas sp.]
MTRTLVDNERGATIVEFGFVAPVFMLALVGIFDVSHSLYLRAVLQGIVQKVGRDSGLETNTTQTARDTLDARVRAQIIPLANNATVDITRRFYRTFTDAANARPEPWTDTNSNGRCDNGESYTDNNSNSMWDADGSDGGQGGAKDKAVYTVTVTYRPVFPLWRFMGWSNSTQVSATTILANQPYGDQAVYATPRVRQCT